MNTAHAWRRRNARSEYERHHHGPNMTPMVDVVMVILIFFMASTVILGPEMLLAAGLEPDADPTPADPRFAIEAPVFEIRVAPGAGSVAITGLGLTDASLDRLDGAARALAEEADPSRVRMVLTPDDATPYEAVIRVQDILRDVGFRSIGLR